MATGGYCLSPHERMNGSGYPRNLKRDEILTEARILAVADVVRPWLPTVPIGQPWGLRQPLKKSQKNKGIFSNNDVADACLKLFWEKGYQLK